VAAKGNRPDEGRVDDHSFHAPWPQAKVYTSDIQEQSAERHEPQEYGEVEHRLLLESRGDHGLEAGKEEDDEGEDAMPDPRGLGKEADA
jgi:hypothetical protein